MIIIDGHNVVFSRYNSDNVIQCVNKLQEEITQISIRINKKIILVFDGNGGKPLNHEWFTKVNNSLRIVFSGAQMNADSWIANWLSNNQGETVILVTDDVNLFKRVKRKNVTLEHPEQWFAKTNKPIIAEPTKESFGDDEYWIKEFEK